MYRGASTQPFVSPEEALAHYGVKGMKWGVRKEYDPVGRMETKTTSSGKLTPSGKPAPKPPKPLSERQQKRIDKLMSRSDVMNTKIADLKAENKSLVGNNKPAKVYTKYVNNRNINDLEKSKKRALKDAEAVKKGKLTSKQKKLIIGGVVVGTMMAVSAYGAANQSGALNQARLLAQARIHGQDVPFKVNKDLSKSMSAQDLLKNVAKPVNPGYSKAGGKMNCRRSTFAYELRRRGYDVQATTSAAGWGQSESGVINAVTPGGKKIYRATSLSETVVKTGAVGKGRGDKRINPLTKTVLDGLRISPEEESRRVIEMLKRGDGLESIQKVKQSSSKKVLEELAKQPNGARGEVVFRFDQFGHSMAYEIVGGKPKIFDSQKGKMFDLATRVESKWDGFHSAEITRLDNVDLDLGFLSRWATNVPGGK